MTSTDSLVDDARSLMQRAMRYYDRKYGFGTMSCAPYDTAWVAMVAKTVDGKRKWLFPECFEYLIATQFSSGAWTMDTSTSIDGILNTAGPLLALKRHASNPLQLNNDTQFLEGCITRATAALKSRLATWDVSTTDHVGFEIIVPAILELLRQEDDSLDFDFDAREPLMKINKAKLSRFRPEYLYGSHRTTALHSLESFIGKIDFDKMIHHVTNGSMLGSPSSTAAYLMHSSRWDNKAEAYLRKVIKFASGQNNGGVPSAFPSTYFEISWMLSTLFRAGYMPNELNSVELSQMTDILSEAFENEGGVLGFAPHFEPDVDDTAKMITCLSQLGQPVSPNRLIEIFEGGNHFRTYAGERDPSLTANCNVLISLLQSYPSIYSSQILKATKFICDYWWGTDGKIKDKWNTSYLYPSVLLVESLTDVLEAIESGKLDGVFDQNSMSRLAITLFQACFRPLLDQETNGSWNNSIEETAYGILILNESRKLHFFDDLLDPIDRALKRGVRFIKSNGHQQDDHYWIEKVSYSSPVLSQSYILAALRVASTQNTPSIGLSVWDRSYASGQHKHVKLFGKASLFSQLPRWELHGSMVEAALFSSLLRTHRSTVFNRTDLEEDKYFDVIPFFWTSSNNRARTYASTSFLYEMSRIALLNFQVDEFMEATAGPTFEGRFDELRDLIRGMLEDDLLLPVASSKNISKDVNGATANGANGTSSPEDTDPVHDLSYHKIETFNLTERDSGYIQVVTHLSRFLNYILQHQYVKSASEWDQKLLKRELKTYLLAHTQQAEDSSRFGNQKDTVSITSTTFFNWVRTTSADHISCPYSFAFVSCYLSSTLTPQGGGADCFPSIGEKYLANAVCRHLSTMCRMYNDLGSTERDHSEGNLNSIDFPEFRSHHDMKSKQKALLSLAEYERQAYIDAFGHLEKTRLEIANEGTDAEANRLGNRRMEIWTMFCEEVDLYGQVYVVSDISSRILASGQKDR